MLKTHSDEILYRAKRVCTEAITLAGRDHTSDDFKTLLTRLGSAVEVFLKDHVYGGTSNNRNFLRLINGLEPLGVSAESRDHLHALRLAYNNAKHDPDYDAPIREVISVLTNARLALEEIDRLSLGDSHQPASKVLRRLLWFAAWDHYIGGDIEIGIFLPAGPGVDMPWSIETIYLKMEDWDDVKRELKQVGTMCFGGSGLPSNVFNFWKSQGDFLDAGTFEGDLRGMITVFARHERVEDILPDLKRENDSHSILAAALFAVTDLVRLDQLPQDSASLVESIATIASDHYAAPTTSRLLQTFARLIADLIGRCERRVITRLTGPIWVSPAQYLEFGCEGVARSEEPVCCQNLMSLPNQ